MQHAHNPAISSFLSCFSTRILVLSILALALAACGGSSKDKFRVEATAGPGGSISADRSRVNGVPVDVVEGQTTTYTVTPDTGYSIDTVSGCGGSLSGNTYTTAPITADCSITASFVINKYSVSATAGTGGTITPDSSMVDHGDTAMLTITPDTGYGIDTVSGCNGSLSGNTYTTGAITADCTVNATFSLNRYTVSTSAGAGGSITPSSATVNHGETANFTVVVDTGKTVGNISGCGITLLGNGVPNTYDYVTSAITADCTVTVSFVSATAQPTLGYQAVKKFRFSWTDVPSATHYRLLEDPDGSSGFSQVGADIPQGTQVYDHIVSLHRRVNARYILQTCKASGCLDSSVIQVDAPSMVGAIGNLQASNKEANANDYFGKAVAISGDGLTLAIGAYEERSAATGINGDQADNSKTRAGAVYVFTRNSAGDWSQQAYIKASNTDADDRFGEAVALSTDGNTLAVGAIGEDSLAQGINGDQADNSGGNTGVVYIFVRDAAGNWSQQAYVKASNTPTNNQFLGILGFGFSVALNSDGSTLAVGAYGEDTTVSNSGAVYVFNRDNTGNWTEQAFIKAGNPDAQDYLGYSVALSADGNTLAAGAYGERSNATGINGDETNNAAGAEAGAVFVFSRDAGGTWSQQAYIKASNTEGGGQFGTSGDRFGYSVALAADGNTLAVGAPLEDSDATGINGDQGNASCSARNFDSGAVYVLVRDAAGDWSQQAYVKASNTPTDCGERDDFGLSVALSGDGNTLLVGAPWEDGPTAGLNGSQTNGANNSGAAYEFTRDAGGNWSQRAYIKASNNTSNSHFAIDAALNTDGSTLLLGSELDQVYLY